MSKTVAPAFRANATTSPQLDGTDAKLRTVMAVNRLITRFAALLLASALFAGAAQAASPCDSATFPNQCGVFTSATLPPFVYDAIASKGGALGDGSVLVLTSGDPNDQDTEISNDMSQNGCGTNPDGWETYDCNLLDNYVPPEDSVVLALSSEWFEWYQSIFTDWMTISAGGVPTVDVSINSWINFNKVDIIPYGPMDTGVVILTSLAKSKMVNFRVADSGDHIYDTAIVVVPATWFGALSGASQDKTLLCGNGSLEPGEDCDDGNNVTDDGCSSICLGTQPPPATTPKPATCGNLVYAWPNGTTAPYTCGNDLCGGYRCVVSTTISPACYTADQCAAACAGTCVDVQLANLDCSSMCAVQPPANTTPPPLPTTCPNLFYTWPDGTAKSYTCDDTCAGQRCVVGTTISPACYTAAECTAACAGGTCVTIADMTCADLCGLGDDAAQVPETCDTTQEGQMRSAPNQKGRCYNNEEICKSEIWKIADGSWEWQDEMCNGLDDDCNGVADDMFRTCGDPGLCQNTVNTCDPAHPMVPVPCVKLPAPSPVEICNNGLDDDCDGSADDGCECGDDECMPGESYANCPLDCAPPANGTLCDDGDLCTTGDVWESGNCKPGAPVVCDSGNECLVAGSCDSVKGCSATKVTCDDGEPCTTDTCEPTSGCAHVTDPTCGNGLDEDGDGFAAAADGGTDCNDTDPAVHPGAVELCNDVDDNCDGQIDEGFANEASCDDGDACTEGDTCKKGICAGTPKVCTTSDQCQTGTCDSGTGLCSNLAKPNGAACDDANLCTQSDTCQAGVCAGANPVACTNGDQCNDPGTCAPATGQCSPPVPKPNNTSCNDANACTLTDTCQAGVCTGSNPDPACANADLSLALKVVPKHGRVGRKLEYRIKVKNLGPDSATSAMAEFMCSGLPFQLMEMPSGCMTTGSSIKCDLGTLNDGAAVTREIVLVPEAAGMLMCTAHASSAAHDPVPTNQSSDVDTEVR